MRRRLPRPLALALSARRDLIPVYAFAGDPKRAYEFFRLLSGDTGRSSEQTFALMDRLGQSYVDSGHYAEGITVYQDLVRRDSGPRRCVYQGIVTAATVVSRSPDKATNGTLAAAAAHASVLCYWNRYAEQHRRGADRKSSGHLPGMGDGRAKRRSPGKGLEPKVLTATQLGMITAFARHTCHMKPDPGDCEAIDRYVKIEFARGRTYFEAQHWEEAAVVFRRLAIDHPDHEVGIYAALLYLEALNVLGSSVEPTRPSCHDDLAVDVRVFIEEYCGGDKARADGAHGRALVGAQTAIERLRAPNR